nr:hypothetical protein 7 [Balneolaceae bacterium]
MEISSLRGWKSLINKIRYNKLEEIHVFPSQGLIEAKINDTRVPVDKIPVKTKVALHYFFDFNFKVTNIGTSDPNLMMVKKFYKKGIIQDIPDQKYFEDYKDSLLYLEGNSFNAL